MMDKMKNIIVGFYFLLSDYFLFFDYSNNRKNNLCMNYMNFISYMVYSYILRKIFFAITVKKFYLTTIRESYCSFGNL